MATPTTPAGSAVAPTWQEFVDGVKRNEWSLRVDKTKAMAIVDQGFAGKGEMWSQILYSWIAFGLIVAALPMCIWWRWYWAVLAVIGGVVVWRATKDSATQFIAERCVRDRGFYEACLRCGAILVARK